MLLLIDNYDSFTFNLFQMIQMQTDEPVEVHRNDRIGFGEILEKRPSGIVLSPGPGHPAVDRDFGVCLDILRNHHDVNCPVLGVCLGHQGIVHAHGGKVVRAPRIVHGKTSEIKVLEPSRLFEGLPESFTAMRYHSLVAEEETFPEALKVTARDTGEGLVMALEHREAPIFGVQFHPESIGTPEGARILKNFLNAKPQ